MNENNINWLLSCPCNDCNFKNHLKYASIDELKATLSQLPEYHNKTKIKVIKSEIRRRTKE